MAAYPIARSDPAPVNRLHQTPLLVRNVPHPVRLARRDQQMCRPPVHTAVQLVRLVDVEPRGVVDRAGRAVAVTVIPVNGGIDLAEERIVRRDGREAVRGFVLGGGGGSRKEERAATEYSLHGFCVVCWLTRGWMYEVVVIIVA